MTFFFLSPIASSSLTMGQTPSCDVTSTPAQRRAVFCGSKPSVEAIAELIKAGRSRKILVVAGAGISVSAGIPDFRTPGTGLYANLQRFRLPRPEAIFDINFFTRNPRPFFALAREMFPGNFDPTPTHFFLRLLAEKGLLRRIYTQNIDTLERIAGIPADVLVEAHGSFATSTCRKCGANYDLAWLKRKLLPVEEAASAAAAASSASSPADLTKVRMSMCDAPGCGGLVKPDITFFGEDLPDRFHRLVPGDVAAADMVLVLGTSLQVAPVGGIPFSVGPFVPRLLINREAVGLEHGYESPEEEDDGDNHHDPERAAEMEFARQQLRAQITAAKAAARATGRAAAAEAASAAASAAEGGSDGEAEGSESSPASKADPAAVAAAGAEAADAAAPVVDPEIEAEVEEAMAAVYEYGGARSGAQRFRTPSKFIFGRRGNYRDVYMAGDCDASVLRLAELLGWTDELAALQARELERLRHERLGTTAPSAAAPAAAIPTTPAALRGAAGSAAESSEAAACGGAGAVAEAPPKSASNASAEKPSRTEAAVTGLEDAVSKLSL